MPRRGKEERPRVIPAGKTQSLIRAALKPDILPPALDLELFESGRASLVRSLPAWVERFGLLTGRGHYLLWCEPGPSPDDTFPSQMVFDVPRGRYLVDILDTARFRWMSRESAEGGPLVAGLTYTGNPVLVWMRPVRPSIVISSELDER